jgi:hypothetical protein
MHRLQNLHKFSKYLSSYNAQYTNEMSVCFCIAYNKSQFTSFLPWLIFPQFQVQCYFIVVVSIFTCLPVVYIYTCNYKNTCKLMDVSILPRLDLPNVYDCINSHYTSNIKTCAWHKNLQLFVPRLIETRYITYKIHS